VDFSYPRRAELRERPEFQAKVNEATRLLHQVEEEVRA
jgi:NitT/TauT family transport system ATP-binding protein